MARVPGAQEWPGACWHQSVQPDQQLPRTHRCEPHALGKRRIGPKEQQNAQKIPGSNSWFYFHLYTSGSEALTLWGKFKRNKDLDYVH